MSEDGSAAGREEKTDYKTTGTGSVLIGLCQTAGYVCQWNRSKEMTKWSFALERCYRCPAKMGFRTAPWAFQVSGADWLNWGCSATLYCVCNKTSNKIKLSSLSVTVVCWCWVNWKSDLWKAALSSGLELSWHLWFECLWTLWCEFISDLGFYGKLEISFQHLNKLVGPVILWSVGGIYD